MSVYVFPGQGSQKLGMGELLFNEFPELLHIADQVVGYSIAELCLRDPNNQLNKTEFTQVALYVVNALSYFKKIKDGAKKPDYFLGHSLGEYNALCAAGVFDFETGLRIVQKRGRLMSQFSDGGMAAVIGLKSNDVLAVLQQNNCVDLLIANYNAYTQHVISGPAASIVNAQRLFLEAGARLYIPLRVSGAFHSPYMNEACLKFTEFLAQYSFFPPEIPVISNVQALPYPVEQIHSIVSSQVNQSVKWVQSIEYLLSKGETQFEEIGLGRVLTNLIVQIKKGL